MSRISRRWPLGLALAIAVAGSLIAHRHASDAETLARAHEALARGDAATAARSFVTLAASYEHGAAARGGLRVCAALDPGLAELLPADGPSPLAGFPLRTLLNATLQAGDAKVTVRLAALAEEAGDPLGVLYRAAALAQGDDHARAEALAAAQPELFAGHFVGQRVLEVARARSGGAAQLVRDGRGRLIGHIDDDGELRPLAPESAAWIPEPTWSELAALPATAGPALPTVPHLESVRLSLDVDIARLAESALGGRRGSIVVVNATTGEVLAAASDARSRRRGGTPAFEERREPASIIKLLTTSAALRMGHDPDAEVGRMVCHGVERYAGQALWCSYKAGPLLSLDRAMAVSCNTAFASLGVSVGRAALLDELRLWGFDRADLIGAGHVNVAAGDARQLADMAIGLEATDITPLHAALLAATVATGGVMPTPRLVSGTDGALGLSPRGRPRAQGRRVLGEAAAAVLWRTMEAVADYGGTAAGLPPPGFPVAMKTGTASEWRRGYHVNYIGFGPLPEAEVAFCVRLTHQPSSRRVRDAAQLVTRQLLEGLGEIWARRHARPGAAPQQP